MPLSLESLLFASLAILTNLNNAAPQSRKSECSIQAIFPNISKTSTPADGLSLGSLQAPVRFDIFFDPVAEESWTLWINLQRLVANTQGEIYIYLRPTRPVNSPTNPQDTLRQWLIASSNINRFQQALRMLERDGYQRTAIRLRQVEQHKALAEELKITPQELVRTLVDDCAEQQFFANNREFQQALKQPNGQTSRLPAMIINQQGGLKELEGIQRYLHYDFAQRHRPLRILPMLYRTTKPTRLALIYPPANAGLMLGDISHAHRLVVVIGPEPRPMLERLAPALEFRQRFPEHLAIQIIVQDSLREASLLQKRFCAANELDLETEYVRLLAKDVARDPIQINALEQIEQTLDDLVKTTNKVCEPSKSISWPMGVWLDGEAIDVSNDLPWIDARIQTLDVTNDALAPIFHNLPKGKD